MYFTVKQSGEHAREGARTLRHGDLREQPGFSALLVVRVFVTTTAEYGLDVPPPPLWVILAHAQTRQETKTQVLTWRLNILHGHFPNTASSSFRNAAARAALSSSAMSSDASSSDSEYGAGRNNGVRS